MRTVTGTVTVDPLTDENKITILTIQNEGLRAALDAMTAERDAARG